jgi:hypothetical protein
MINDYIRGRACIEFVRGNLIQGGVFELSFSSSFSFGFKLFYAFSSVLPLFMSFVGLAIFPSSR